MWQRAARQTPSSFALNAKKKETGGEKKDSWSSSYCPPTRPPFIRHPQGLEGQSPPIAAGHRSPRPWRRQPTYCQLTLKTEDISSLARPPKTQLKTCGLQSLAFCAAAASSLTPIFTLLAVEQSRVKLGAIFASLKLKKKRK